MSCSRRNASLWFWLRIERKSKYGGRSIKELVTDPYFWYDSFGKYLGRIWCKVFGHKKIQNVANVGEPTQLYCFNCSCELRNKEEVKDE